MKTDTTLTEVSGWRFAFRNMTIRARMTLIVGIGTVALIIIAGMAIQSLYRANSDFETGIVNTVLVKQKHMEQIRNLMGYGGYVHAFKDYVSLGRSKDFKAAMKDANAMYASIKNWQKMDTVIPAEITALKRLQEMVRRYRQATVTAKQLRGEGKTVAKIDAAVEINDAPYIAAFDTLASGLDKQVKIHMHGQENLLTGATITMTAVATIAILLFGFVGLLIYRSMEAPIAQTMARFRDIAEGEGDLTRRIDVRSTDEIGQLGASFNTFADRIQGTIKAIGANAQTLAGASEQMTAVSQQMGANAEETSAQANVVSAASEQVSANIQTVATGMEELSAATNEIASNATEAAGVATEAVEVTQEADHTISKLDESSAEIGEIINTITSIAQQTRLLALNATIEAARAGEAGKGFAVVANEVKDLAMETARASDDISRKIGAIQSDTKGAVDAIARISEIIARINEFQNTIASAVEEQSATAGEIARNVNEAASGSTEIARNITGVAEAAQGASKGANDTHQASGELASMAAELQQLIGQFKYA